MNTLEAEDYCELIAIYNRKISERLTEKKYKNAMKISRTIDYKDGTANQATDNTTEISTLEIMVDGEKINLPWPERWLKTYAYTLKKYGERYGQDWALTIRYRYNKGWEPTKTYVYQGISRRSFSDRRSAFLKMLAIYAVKNRLLPLE